MSKEDIPKVSNFTAGTLASKALNWKAYTKDPWVLSQVTGMTIPVKNWPMQKVPPIPYVLTKEERPKLDAEILNMCKLKIIKKVTDIKGQYVSNVFTRQKPDGSVRVILDLSKFNNEVVEYNHFKMCSLQTAIEMLRQGAWMGSVDLEKCYYSFPIHRAYRKFLRFKWNGVLYEYQVLPNGLASGPRYVTKILSPIFAKLREEGIEVFVYIDDTFIIADSKEKCQKAIDRVLFVLQDIGFFVNFQKSILTPKQKITFLGFILNSTSMTIEPTSEKIQKFLHESHKLLQIQKPTVRQVAKVVGLMTAYSPSVDYAGLHTKRLEIDKNLGLFLNKGNFDGLMIISNEGIKEIKWWQEHFPTSVKPIRVLIPEIEIFSDASDSGWGAHRDTLVAGSRWTPEESNLWINEKELLAIEFGLKSLIKEENVIVKINTDNITAKAYIRRMGGIHSATCNEISQRIWHWCMARNIFLISAYVPGVENVTADFYSRNFADDIEWELNPKIFKRICKCFGTPHVDLFASRINNKLDRYVSIRPDPNCWKTDAFTIDWSDNFMFIFPPFSVLGKVVQRLRKFPSRCIVVTPTWYNQFWFPMFDEIALCLSECYDLF